MREEMAQLRRRCERLIWLNPLAGADDYLPLVEGVAAVLPFVDDFLPIRNFESLELLGRTLSRLPIRDGEPRTRPPSRLSEIPVGRMGEPQDIASLCSFLCSDAAAFITGQTIHVNGGERDF